MAVKLKISLTLARLVKSLLDAEAEMTLARIERRKEMHLPRSVMKRMITRTKRYQSVSVVLGKEIQQEQSKQWQRKWNQDQKKRVAKH